MSSWWWRFRLCVYRRYSWNHNDFQTVRSWGFRLTACSVSLVGSFRFQSASGESVALIYEAESWHGPSEEDRRQRILQSFCRRNGALGQPASQHEARGPEPSAQCKKKPLRLSGRALHGVNWPWSWD